jgi:hypothetical protein
MNSHALLGWLVVALAILGGVALFRWERRKARRMDQALQRALFETAD